MQTKGICYIAIHILMLYELLSLNNLLHDKDHYFHNKSLY